MESFIGRSEGDLPSQGQASGSRRQLETHDNSSSTGEGVTGANKRQKPSRRVSKLSLPRKRRATDTSGLFEGSSNGHGSASLRERLAGRPASGRQLGDALPTSRRTNAENETPLLAAASQTATKAVASVRATTTAATEPLIDTAVAASMLDEREQGNGGRRDGAVVSQDMSSGSRRRGGGFTRKQLLLSYIVLYIILSILLLLHYYDSVLCLLYTWECLVGDNSVMC